MASPAPQKRQLAANDPIDRSSVHTVSPISKELVIALVGYAGAGTSTAAGRILAMLDAAGYNVQLIKFSDLIAVIDQKANSIIQTAGGVGISKYERASEFQDRGDQVRLDHGNFALASAAIQEIKVRRGASETGSEKIAYVLDSLKHPDEVSLLRRVYDHTFRLVAVHCDKKKRFGRLFGELSTTAKYAGVTQFNVEKFMDRDEKDVGRPFGQRVRDVFYQADFFLDNSADTHDGSGMTGDIGRFVGLLLGNGLYRPTAGEKAIYVAHSSALQSACLSRQVGAALISKDGRLVATGKNDPPKFGGGTYDEDSAPDHRCFKWKFEEDGLEFRGCHNDRKKSELRTKIASWIAEEIAPQVAKKILPEEEFMGTDRNSDRRNALSDAISAAVVEIPEAFEQMPGVSDAIEYSRSIHAEMAALMAAARGGISTAGATLYVTVFPCHNCARHLVAAGIRGVYFIEPYVKSLAFELHDDSISQDPSLQPGEEQSRMAILPFTGVGPRMYDDFFAKRKELKGSRGVYDPQDEGEPPFAVRLRELTNVEDSAVGLVAALK